LIGKRFSKNPKENGSGGLKPLKMLKEIEF
jgi:hypothetical protein